MSEEELLRQEIAELHAKLLEKDAAMKKLCVDFDINIYDMVVDNFSDSFDVLLEQLAVNEKFEFLGREYEPKKYAFRATSCQAALVRKTFCRYVIFHRIEKREKETDVYLVE